MSLIVCENFVAQIWISKVLTKYHEAVLTVWYGFVSFVKVREPNIAVDDAS